MDSLRDLTRRLRHDLLRGRSAPIPGLGTLHPEHIPARPGQRPDGSRVTLPPSTTLRFDPMPPSETEDSKIGAMLRRQINQAGEIMLPGIGRIRKYPEGLVFTTHVDLRSALNRSYRGLNPTAADAEPSSRSVPTDAQDLDADLDEVLAPNSEAVGGDLTLSDVFTPGDTAGGHDDNISGGSSSATDHEESDEPVSPRAAVSSPETLETANSSESGHDDSSQTGSQTKSSESDPVWAEREPVSPLGPPLSDDTEDADFDVLGGAAPADSNRREPDSGGFAFQPFPVPPVEESSPPASFRGHSARPAWVLGGVAALVGLALLALLFWPREDDVVSEPHLAVNTTSTQASGGALANDLSSEESSSALGDTFRSESLGANAPDARVSGRAPEGEASPSAQETETRPPSGTSSSGLDATAAAALTGDTPIDLSANAFTWVVNSTPSLTEARNQVARYHEQGFRSRVVQARAGGSTRYRVVVGQFSTRPQAERLRNRLPDDARPDSWILRFSSL